MFDEDREICRRLGLDDEEMVLVEKLVDLPERELLAFLVILELRRK